MRTKKGFTLIEIVVVVVVLGILALVMIPIISSAVYKTQKENDKILVDNMNVILEADEPYSGRPVTGNEVLWILTGNGFEVGDPNYKDYSFYWSKEDNKVAIYDREEEKVIFPTECIEVISHENMIPDNGWYILSGESTYDELAYKITYYVNGRKIKFNGKTSYDGLTDVILPQPEFYADGYTFNGWYDNANLSGEKIDKILAGTTKDLVFYSSFIKNVDEEPTGDKYSITYHLNGGSFNTTPQMMYASPLVAEITLPIPTRAGYTFNGWFTTYNFVSGTKVDNIPAGSTGNKVYYALWSKDVTNTIYKIVYDLQGGTLPVDAPIEYDGTKEIILPTPTREGYTFSGWTENDENGESITNIPIGSTGDKLLYANWAKIIERPNDYTFYITYVLNGGILHNPPTVMDQTSDVYLFTPLRRGYEFEGWYLDKDFTGEAITVITKAQQIEDITVYAKWTAIDYDINYELNGGYWMDSNTVNYTYQMDTVTKYTQEVLRDGYGFAGWYDNPEFSGEPVLETAIGDTGAKTLYAKWSADEFIIIYITYAPEQNMDLEPTKFKATDSFNLPTPNRKGYEFKGWYEDDEFIGPIVTRIEENTTTSKIFYARWEIIKYNINYVVTKDSETISFNNKITNYTIEDTLDFRDIQPSTKYYEFKGWYTNPECTGDVFTTINKGTIDDITLYAKWEGIELILPAEFNGGTLSNRTINHFAEELVADMNVAGQAITGQETTVINFKKTSNKNINYLWGKGNTEMIEKYQWFFEFAETELLAAADSSDYYTQNGVKHIYNSVVKMFDQLLAKNSHALDSYNYHENGLCNDCGVTHNGEVYAAVGDTEGHNKTLFRAWIDGLINSTFYYSADIYRAAMVDFSETENMRKFNVAYTGKELEVVTKDSLPIPVQKGYEFQGWYDNAEFTGESYETTADIYDLFSQWDASNQASKKDDFKLYAKWQAKTKYEITFDMNGGHWEDMSLDKFANELVYFFKIAHQEYDKDNDSYPDTTIENFYNTSRPNIHVVWYDAALWNKYHWLFEFAESEIVTYANKAGVTLTNITMTMFDKITSNKDSAINVFKKGTENYKNHTYATPLDILCEWIHCVINQSKPVVHSWLPDYSKSENITRFYEAYNATKLNFNLYQSEVLPMPIREGYTFLGWYNNPEFTGSPVSIVNASGNLYAKWQLTQNVNNDEQLANALNNAYNGDTIVLNAGSYENDYTITTPYITIIGPNAAVNPNTGSRLNEAVLKGVININSSATNLKLIGLAFTENSRILGTEIKNFTFENNYVYETTNRNDEWEEGEKFDSGFIYIRLPNEENSTTNLSQSLNFINNKFENVADVNVNIAQSKNVTFSGNVFKNFEYDAIRFGDGYTDGEIKILNNQFIQDTMGGYNGIYFRMYGKVKTSTGKITIKGNIFKNIGNQSTSSLYTGAISARNYKEFGATFEITGNYFEKCLNYIRIRNDASTSNHSSYPWSCTIDQNRFIGIPTKYYFASRSNSDSNDGRTPIKTIFGANYYEDDNGNVLKTFDNSKFLEVANTGSILLSEPLPSGD